MEIETIGAIAIGIVVFIVSVLIIISFSYDIRLSFISKIKGTFSNLYSQIFGRGYYNICQAYDGDYISFNDFGVLLNAYYNQKCGDRKTCVILSFSLSIEDVKELSKELEIAKEGELIYYGSADEPLGVGGIIIDSDYDDYVFKFKDCVTIWNDGSPEKDTLLKLTGVNCDIYDNACGITTTVSTTTRPTTTTSVTTSSITTTTSSSTTSTTIPTPQWSQCFSPDWTLGKTCADLCKDIGKECVNDCSADGMIGYGSGDTNCGSSHETGRHTCDEFECVWPGFRDSCKCCCR